MSSGRARGGPLQPGQRRPPGCPAGRRRPRPAGRVKPGRGQAGPGAFTFRDKGFVVSVGTRRGVADIAGITTGGRLAHGLKDAIEWEYRQSVRHLRGWDPVAR